MIHPFKPVHHFVLGGVWPVYQLDAGLSIFDFYPKIPFFGIEDAFYDKILWWNQVVIGPGVALYPMPH
jgi:hypothetical protein